MKVKEINALHQSTAFILAGGKSLRMGSDKGLIDFKGQPMISYVLDAVQPLFAEINIISNNNLYLKFGFPVLEDLIKGIGPLGGLLTGLQYAQTNWSFFIACDLPFVQTSIIQVLMNERFVGDAIVPVYKNKLEPLCAFFNKNCIPKIQQQINIGNYKMTDLILELKTKLVEMPLSGSGSSNPFDNMNTLNDIRKSIIS